ncbi:MAG: universal stress protein [Spirosomaceae bacterium]|jgi:nucleotide-binding universal stress UspA family protein|nr:universal stress protein [Spirosomataceae bacterium]
MKTILVTTDFSSNSKSAIRFAIQLSAQTACQFVFYNVLEINAPTSWPKAEVEKYLASELDKGKQQMKKFLDKLFQQHKVQHLNYQYEVAIGNDVSSLIMSFAKSKGVDYICMGTRGAGIFQKFIGTHASALVNASVIPVIVVPKNYRFRSIQTVGYSSDLEHIEEEFSTVLAFSHSIGASTQVYHFNMKSTKANKKKQQELQARLGTGNATFFCITQKVDDTFVENLQRTVRRKKPSVLIMFSKFKPNWIQRLFFTGFTATMTFELSIPLISFRKN